MIKNRDEWLSSIREVSLLPDSPVAQKNGIWDVVQRKETWEAVGPRIFDEHLDRFRKIAVEVLRERDPQFELDSNERFAANVYGKPLKYSRELRGGLSETLALLGSFPTPLTSCSDGKAEATATLAVREILADADSIRWGSLNDHLPMLAEAAPDEFLRAVENATMASPSPFEEIYCQESGGIMGRNYMTGLLWALETIAWHPDHLTRVIVLLGDLAELDPGGQSANRPLNSARDILLPWHPQTSADISRRKAAVMALLHEHPGVGWQLLLGLLPESNVITTGTRKPKWQDFIGPEFSEKVTVQAYWEQIGIYAEFAMNEAASDSGKLPNLIGRLPDLPEQAQTRLLGILGSEEVSNMPGPDQRPIWEALVSLVAQHRKYPDADWAMVPETIAKIDEVASKLAPASPSLLHRRLFSDNNFDLFEGNDGYHDQQRILAAKRESAVKDIIAASGLQGVVAFAESVDSPSQVGLSLGLIGDNVADAELLPAYLINANKKLERLSVGYLLGRFRAKGWEWVDKTNTQNWTLAQKGTFLASLPFTRETWLRAERILGADISAYWKKTSANPYEAEEGDLPLAAEQLLSVGRARQAAQCMERLTHGNGSAPVKLVIRVLQANQTSSEPTSRSDQHAASKLIGWLQENSDAPSDELAQIEWNYLPFLLRDGGGSPKMLMRRLASDPAFFCKIIRAVFRSKNEDDDKTDDKGAPTEKRNWLVETPFSKMAGLFERVRRAILGLVRKLPANELPPEERKRIAENAYRLLYDWHLPPGRDEQRQLDEGVFRYWVDEVKRSTKASGHFEVAMSQLGQVLPYCGADPSGLWIHRAAADVLNAKDGSEMRTGFTCKLFNMRGVHGFTAGKQEREFAARYRQMAKDVEDAGFHRLATALRDLAISYEDDAERQAKRGPLGE